MRIGSTSLRILPTASYTALEKIIQIHGKIGPGSSGVRRKQEIRPNLYKKKMINELKVEM